MKHLKILGLAAMAMAATVLMVFAGTASATTLTSPAGTTYTSTIKLVSEGGLTWQSELYEGTCDWVMEGKVESHGPASTASSTLSTLSIPNWGWCFGNGTISVLRRGSLVFHTDGEEADGNGIVTWDGLEIRINYGGFSCTYGTGAGSVLGTLTGSKGTGGKATVHVSSFELSVTGGSIICGESGTLTGSLQVATPSYLDVD